MEDINNFTLVGRLTRDPELRYTASGTALLECSVASNRRVKKGETWEDKTSFFDFQLWGKRAESLKPILRKGSQVVLSGKLEQQRWEKDGQKHSKVALDIQDIVVAGSREEKKEDGGHTDDRPDEYE